MLDWISPIAFLQTILRVLLVWSAFYMVGHLLEKPLRVRRLFPLIPKEIIGMLGLMALEVVLSLMGVMNRTVTPIILLLLSFPGLLLIVRNLVRGLSRAKLTVYSVFFMLVLVVISIENFAYASMPNFQFDDPLVTYAVQPDRWLNAGGIYWLNEVPHSGFPLTYEMIAVWPASLSFNRLDQLSVLQVFQMSMLLVALFRGMQILRIRKRLMLPFAATALLCTMLYYWCSLAKTDTAAILFTTIALSCAVKELSDRSLKPYTSWLLMGISLATKQTSLLILALFLPYAGWRIFREHWKAKITALACLVILPGIFAVRTMSVTGSPTYPVRQVSFLVDDDWRLMPPPEEIRTLNDRSSDIHSNRQFSLAKQIGIYLTSMEGLLLVFLAGLVITIVRKPRKAVWIFPVILYFIVAIYVLWPPWWGAKYTILSYPFVGLIGLKLLQDYKRTSRVALSVIAAAAFVVPGFIVAPNLVYPAAYRYSVAKFIIQGNWETESGYKVVSSSGEGMTHMWLNSFLTEPSTILSIHEEKRYFCDHTVYVGWRHPATQALFLDNSLEEECTLMDRLGVEYVTFYRNDPCIYEMENRLEILDHIGPGNVLEPLITVSRDFQVCRYNSPLD